MSINFKIVAVATGPASGVEHGLAVGASRGAEAVFSEGAEAVLRGKTGSKTALPREKRAEKPVFRGKRAVSLL